jgi:hypothetical protein
MPNGKRTGNKNLKSCIGESGYINRYKKDERTQTKMLIKGIFKDGL